MIIHFICRGNAFRSRMAETYFNSLEIDGVKAISSGTVAKQHSESNKANFLITLSVLEKHGLKKYTKANWDQLNKERLLESDLTIFLNDNVRKECQKLFGLPTKYKVWDIPDFDEIATELEKKQQELNDRLKLLSNDNKQFQVTASYLLDLAQRAEQLFKNSDDSLKQKLLEYMLSNIELNDKKLSYSLNDPFRTMSQANKKAFSGSENDIWCG